MVPWGTINGLFIGANLFCVLLYAVSIALAKRFNAGEALEEALEEERGDGE